MLFSWNTNIRGGLGCQKALRIIRAVLSNWAPGLELLSVSGCGFESSVSSQTPHGESSRSSSVCMACRKLSASLVLWMKWKWWIKMGVHVLVFESLSLALPYGGVWMVRTGRGSVTLQYDLVSADGAFKVGRNHRTIVLSCTCYPWAILWLLCRLPASSLGERALDFYSTWTWGHSALCSLSPPWWPLLPSVRPGFHSAITVIQDFSHSSHWTLGLIG